MNRTAMRARAVHYRQGSTEMAAFQAADQHYRDTRHHLEAIWDGQVAE